MIARGVKAVLDDQPECRNRCGHNQATDWVNSTLITNIKTCCLMSFVQINGAYMGLYGSLYLAALLIPITHICLVGSQEKSRASPTNLRHLCNDLRWVQRLHVRSAAAKCFFRLQVKMRQDQFPKQIGTSEGVISRALYAYKYTSA